MKKMYRESLFLCLHRTLYKEQEVKIASGDRKQIKGFLPCV